MITTLEGNRAPNDFTPDSQIPNHPAYRSDPAETKNISSQVEELLEKGLIKESLSPCAIPVILVPKKMALGERVLIVEP